MITLPALISSYCFVCTQANSACIYFVIFYGLEKYSLYEVKVSASTSAGEGMNASNQFRTEEDSKFYSNLFSLSYCYLKCNFL